MVGTQKKISHSYPQDLRQRYSTFKLLSINPLRQETYGNKLNWEPIEPHTHTCVLNCIGLTESMFRDTDGNNKGKNTQVYGSVVELLSTIFNTRYLIRRSILLTVARKCRVVKIGR